MNITQENIQFIIQILTLGGIIFAIYKTFAKPQEETEVNEAVFTEKFTTLDRELANLRDNHIHTLQTRLDNHITESQTTALSSAEKLGRIEGKLDTLINK